MGKTKKGKRNDKDNDLESDGDDVTSITDSLKNLKVDKAKPAKKTKKSKQAQADSESESDSEISKNKQKNKNKKKGSFDSDEELEDEKPKTKGKQKKGKKNADEDSEDESIKDKKAKKGKKALDSDDSNTESKKKTKSKKGKKTVVDSDESDEEVNVKPKKSGKKGKKDDDKEDENPTKTKGKNKKNVESDDEDFGIVENKLKKSVGEVKSGFALLNVEGDDNEDDDKESVDYDDEDENEKLVSMDRNKKNKNHKRQQEPQTETQGKKGKKGKDKKKRCDSDDDIEKVLAELALEYAGEKKETIEPTEPEEPKIELEEKKKKDKKEKAKAPEVKESENKDAEEDDTGVLIKTAAQKKKEKKEREKAKKMAMKKLEAAKKGDSEETKKDEPIEKVEKPVEKEASDAEVEPEEGEGKKKKKKKGAKEETTKEKGKGPGKKTIVAMQEALKKLKEEEERLKREEEERIRQEELQEQARLEQLRLEQERKEKKKLKEKQRKERLKAEGKLLTTKQKQDRARAQDLINSLKAQGVSLPDVGEKIVRPGTRIKPNKSKVTQNDEIKDKKKSESSEQVELEIVDEKVKIEETKKEEDEVKDSWDAESSEEEDKSEEVTRAQKPKPAPPAATCPPPAKKTPEKEPSVNESESESTSESPSESSSEEESEEDKMTDAERKRERARLRIQNRRIEAEKKKSLDDLRAAVVCVLGHVDTGKTKILDKLRRTHVQDSEAGGITQQIGATNVPIDAIKESTKHVKGYADKKFKIPGLLIIDTPGHESFSNLRNRGSSLCDIAILVVDIMHGLEPQTIESINLLKKKKCPFVVALNKIDRLYDWNTMSRKDVQDIIKAQAPNTQREFERRAKDVVLQFAEQGLNAALYYENPNPRNYVSLVPTSAITGEGMGNLLALIVDACQGPLAKELMFSEELQATVLEVKALPGLGTTIDCILVNGTLREGDTMIVAGTDGPIVTQIRSLLMPQPLKELRVKNAYIEHREVRAAQGVKIAAKDLEKAIAGLNLQVAQKPDEVELLKEEIAKELTSALGNIKLAERGVYVQASTLGALEALLDFLKSSKIPYAGIRIGPVVKKDVMKASIMLEHDSQYAAILAFDVKIERDAQELADAQGVKIFQADIIYHLFDKFTAYREELRQRKRDEHKHIAVFPCKLKILPQFIFNSRDPIIMGVMVEAGIVKEGTPLCVPSRDFIDLGVVSSIEYNHKTVESARKGQEVCIKIEPVPGEAPKMYGRHFDEKDFVVSKISRQSIDACKDYFRDDLVKTDWQLMVELKKLFQIL